MELQGLSIIAGGRAAGTDTVFQAVDPGRGTKLDPVYRAATPDEVDRACERAGEAFPAYSQSTGPQRAAFLRATARELEALGEILLERFVQETGLPAARAAGERDRTCAQLRMFAGLAEDGSWVDARIDRAQPDRRPLPKPDTRSLLRPLGPVAVFGPANFPLAFGVAGGDTASALAAGCPVVVKAHSSHPGVNELAGLALARAAASCGLPPGVFSLLFGSGAEIGTALASHPAIKAVGFTGSRHAGQALFRLCTARPEPIPFFGELSSLNPVFILPEAAAQRAAETAQGLAGSITLGTGQFCTCPNLILVPAGAPGEALVRHLGERLSQILPGVMLSAKTGEAFGKAVAHAACQPEVKAVLPLPADPPPGAALGAPALLSTTVAAFLANPALHEEMFGPAALALTYKGKDDLLAFAANLDGQLTVTLHGTDDDLRAASRLIGLLETKAGRLVFNGYPTGVEVCPSMVHGGPWPATTDSRFTSVGTAAIYRWARPVCYQNAPAFCLPEALADENPLRLARTENGARA